MKRKETGTFLQFGDDQDPRNLEERARLHEQHRGRTVASIIADLHLMAIVDIFPQNCILDAKKAYWQDFKGSKSKDTQAAHCVPCQITITGFRPEQFVRKYSTERANELSAFFGKTDKFLPTVFNQCDSRAERIVDSAGQEVGLVPAFWDACLNAVTAGRSSAKGLNDPNKIVNDIKAAFEEYKTKAKEAFKMTIKAFEDDKRYFTMSSVDRDKAREAATKIKIVKFYKDELAAFKAVNQITRFGEITDLINEYKKIDAKANP
jgi:hypothetical protein